MKYLKEHKSFLENKFIPKEPGDNIFKNEIEDLLLKHIGKRPFFNALDDLIKYDDKYILELVKGCENKHIISTGTFGDLLYDEYEDGEFDCASIVIFNGKICTDKSGIHCLYPFDVDLNNKEFVFIDDSMHSGRTMTTIEDYIKTLGSSITEISVAYDGQQTKDPRTRAIYRYFDEHPEKIK
jgi:hypothetical protein